MFETGRSSELLDCVVTGLASSPIPLFVRVMVSVDEAVLRVFLQSVLRMTLLYSNC